MDLSGLLEGYVSADLLSAGCVDSPIGSQNPHPLGVLGAAATAFTLGAATVISTDQSIYEAAAWEFGDLWITVIVFLLFSSLYHLKVTGKTAKILCFGASGCYGGYLLSHLLDDWCYRLFSGWHRPEYYWLLFLCVTIPIYAASVAAGMLLERFSGVLTRRRRL